MKCCLPHATGRTSNNPRRGAKSADSVKEEFASKYQEFSREDIRKRYRLLLDMFKLQVIFAALSF